MDLRETGREVRRWIKLIGTASNGRFWYWWRWTFGL